MPYYICENQRQPAHVVVAMMIEGIQQLLFFLLHLGQGCQISLTRVELMKKLSGHELANRGHEEARRVRRGGRNSVLNVVNMTNPDPLTVGVESGKIMTEIRILFCRKNTVFGPIHEYFLTKKGDTLLPIPVTRVSDVLSLLLLLMFNTAVTAMLLPP